MLKITGIENDQVVDEKILLDDEDHLTKEGMIVAGICVMAGVGIILTCRSLFKLFK